MEILVDFETRETVRLESLRDGIEDGSYYHLGHSPF